MHTLPARVSYVVAPNDSSVLIAMDVRFQDHTIRWFDTVKERIMTVARVVDMDPAHFVFERSAGEGGGTYTFVPLTLERYRANVQPHLLARKDFDTEEDLFTAFERTREEAW